MTLYILLFCAACLASFALGMIYYTTKDIEEEIKDIKIMLENYKQYVYNITLNTTETNYVQLSLHG